MMKRFALGVVLALAVSACGAGGSDGGQGEGPAPAPTPTVEPTPVPAVYDFSSVEREIETWMDETDGIEGVGAIVVHRDDGVVFKRAFGSFDDERVYLVASTSKMVSAGILLRLQDQGILDMDEPVIDVVGWGETNPGITPGQLVSNTSGLIGLDTTFGPYLCQYIYSGTLQDCGRTIFTTEGDDDRIVPPDTEFRYGGGQWQVAGAVAEIVSGRSWADLVTETYVDPCGLEAFGYTNHFVQFLGEGDDPFNYPQGFDGDLSRLEPTDNPNMEAGLYTTTGDYGEILLMHLRGGMCGQNRVLSEEAIQQSHTDRLLEVVGISVDDQGATGYGYGWWFGRGTESLLFDPGAYGSTAWLDENRGYGAFLVIEATSGLGSALFGRTYPLVNAVMDVAHTNP